VKRVKRIAAYKLQEKLNMKLNAFILILTIIFTISCSRVASESKKQDSHAETHQPETTKTPAENAAMTSRHDAHMRMTELRSAKPEDKARAEEIVVKARKAIEKYKDYKVALREGFEILLPEVPQTMYHFNKVANYIEAESRFNPERPTSLLYEKTSDGYRLIGVMYTAPAGMPEDELDERVPLSVTQWHEHINICLPKGSDTFKGLIGQGDKFGLEGSITTKEECGKEGGQFLPRLLGWMVHLYPYEKTPEAMWSVERQMNGSNRHHMH
jgi:hypothetical protein